MIDYSHLNASCDLTTVLFGLNEYYDNNVNTESALRKYSNTGDGSTNTSLNQSMTYHVVLILGIFWDIVIHWACFSE